MIIPAAGGRILASQVDQLLGASVIKGADESWATTSLHADSALVLAVAANASYLFECYLNYEGATRTNGDIKWTWAVPANASLRYQGVFSDTSATQETGLTYTDSSVVSAGTSGAGTLRGAMMTGSFVTSSTAGSLQFRWAENTLNSGTATIVHEQSYLALWRVS